MPPSDPTTHPRGKLIVVAGPSGAGKGTLLDPLVAERPGLVKSVSATTRPPRPGEEDGVQYFFVDEATFKAMIDGGELLEWAVFADHYYGTPLAPIEAHLAAGRSVVLEIEVQGARQIKARFNKAGSDPVPMIFIAPPSLEVLANRLRHRQTETEAELAKRLKAAEAELKETGWFDVVIVNDDLDTARKTFIDAMDRLLRA
ncbi:MAG: guanylate kinase [Cyanobacteria bacterium HKST-UBA06]|nr:guanylate kinase [Cyanobacteria bacterium HKST-UBA06]